MNPFIPPVRPLAWFSFKRPSWSALVPLLLILMLMTPPALAQEVWETTGAGLRDQICSFYESPIILIAFMVALAVLGCAFFLGNQQGFLAKILGIILVLVAIFAIPAFMMQLPYVDGVAQKWLRCNTIDWG